MGYEVYHTSTSSTEVKNDESIASTPPTCPHGVDRENFTFTFHKYIDWSLWSTISSATLEEWVWQ